MAQLSPDARPERRTQVRAGRLRRLAGPARAAMALALSAGLAMAMAGGAARSSAAAEQVDFDVYVLGLRAGQLSYAAERSASRYALSALATSGGLVGLFSDVRVEATATGRIAAGRFRPERYRLVSVEGGDSYRREIRYDARGAPRLTSDESPEPHWLRPEEQVGALDPLTTLYEVIRDRAGPDPCTINARWTDGTRIGEVRSSPREAGADEVTCTAVYERGAGFTAEELEDGRRFPFLLSYARRGAGWALREVRIDGPMGRARLIRR